MVVYIPSLYDLFRGIWSSDDQMHGPIVLGISIWLIYRNWPTMMAASEGEPSHWSGWLFAVFALLLYAAGIASNAAFSSVCVSSSTATLGA